MVALAFKQIRIDYGQLPTGPTLVPRVVVIVDWFGPESALLNSREIVATTYAYGENGPVLPEGCHTYQD